MPKPDEFNLGTKFGLPGILEFLISGKFSSKGFRITEPEESETSDSQRFIGGIGVKEGKRILLVNEILGVGCYLQNFIGEANSNGEWQVQAKFSEDSSGKERKIYAFAMKEDDTKKVVEIIAASGKIKGIAQFERTLKSNKIKYQISNGKKLIYRKKANATPMAKLVTSVELNVRVRPGANEPILTKLNQGAKIQTLDEISETEGSVWVKILTDSGNGWVNSRFLK